MYICPFCYDNVLPYGNDWPLFQEYLKDISAENGYPGGPSPYTLGYFANGTPLDWQYAEQGVICLAPEIGTYEDFFWPPKSRIVPLAEENLLAGTGPGLPEAMFVLWTMSWRTTTRMVCITPANPLK